MAMIFALAKMVEAGTKPGRHLERVQIYSRALALKLREKSPNLAQIEAEFIEHIYHASPLHDIGKVAIPDAVLLKPNQLTEEEVNVMTSHTHFGGTNPADRPRTVPRNAFINMGIEIARSHHERWDGQGYPQGLKGEAISLADPGCGGHLRRLTLQTMLQAGALA